MWSRIGEITSAAAVAGICGFVAFGLLGADEIAIACIIAALAFSAAAMICMALDGELPAAFEGGCEDDGEQETCGPDILLFQEEYEDREEWEDRYVD